MMAPESTTLEVYGQAHMSADSIDNGHGKSAYGTPVNGDSFSWFNL